jgi:chromosome segregation ATPase
MPLAHHQAKYFAHALSLQDPEGIGRLSQSLFDAKEILICSYAFANRHQDEIRSVPFDLAVIDEAQAQADQNAQHPQISITALTGEIEELDKLIKQGLRISIETKTKELLTALRFDFDKMMETGANERALRNQARQAETLEEQHQLQDDIRSAEKRKRRARREIDDIEDDIEDQRDQLISDLEGRLHQGQEGHTHFTIRFQVG